MSLFSKEKPTNMSLLEKYYINKNEKTNEVLNGSGYVFCRENDKGIVELIKIKDYKLELKTLDILKDELKEEFDKTNFIYTSYIFIPTKLGTNLEKYKKSYIGKYFIHVENQKNGKKIINFIDKPLSDIILKKNKKTYLIEYSFDKKKISVDESNKIYIILDKDIELKNRYINLNDLIVNVEEKLNGLYFVFNSGKNRKDIFSFMKGIIELSGYLIEIDNTKTINNYKKNMINVMKTNFSNISLLKVKEINKENKGNYNEFKYGVIRVRNNIMNGNDKRKGYKYLTSISAGQINTGFYNYEVIYNINNQSSKTNNKNSIQNVVGNIKENKKSISENVPGNKKNEKKSGFDIPTSLFGKKKNNGEVKENNTKKSSWSLSGLKIPSLSGLKITSPFKKTNTVNNKLKNGQNGQIVKNEQNRTGNQSANGTVSTVNNGTGSTVNNGTGSTVNNGTGSTVNNGTGTKVNNGTGSTVNNGTGTKVNNGTGTKVNNGTVSTVNNGTRNKIPQRMYIGK